MSLQVVEGAALVVVAAEQTVQPMIMVSAMRCHIGDGTAMTRVTGVTGVTGVQGLHGLRAVRCQLTPASWRNPGGVRHSVQQTQGLRQQQRRHHDQQDRAAKRDGSEDSWHGWGE